MSTRFRFRGFCRKSKVFRRVVFIVLDKVVCSEIIIIFVCVFRFFILVSAVRLFMFGSRIFSTMRSVRCVSSCVKLSFVFLDV